MLEATTALLKRQAEALRGLALIASTAQGRRVLLDLAVDYELRAAAAGGAPAPGLLGRLAEA
jgi:hypothetical protein